MLFGIPPTIVTSGNTFGCCSPGFTNSSNDNTRPTTDCVFPFGGGDWDACVFEVVGESVLGGASIFASGSSLFCSRSFGFASGSSLFCSCSFGFGGGAIGVASEFGAIFGVGAVAGEDGVVGADVVEFRFIGLAGFTGDTGLVGLAVDFLQASDVVTQGCHTGLPYGSGHVEERVWVMLPV